MGEGQPLRKAKIQPNGQGHGHTNVTTVTPLSRHCRLFYLDPLTVPVSSSSSQGKGQCRLPSFPPGDERREITTTQHKWIIRGAVAWPPPPPLSLSLPSLSGGKAGGPGMCGRHTQAGSVRHCRQNIDCSGAVFTRVRPAGMLLPD